MFLQTLAELKFLHCASLPPSTLSAQPWETVAGNREVLSPRDHSPKGVGRLKTRLPPCLSSLKRLKHSTPSLSSVTRGTPTVWAVSPGGRKLKCGRASLTCFLYLIYCHLSRLHHLNLILIISVLLLHERVGNSLFHKLPSLMKTGTMPAQKTKGRLPVSTVA